MAWVRIDDEFGEHPKVVSAGPLALAIQIKAKCYASRNLTNGFVPHDVVSSFLSGFEGLRIGRKPALSVDWPAYMIDAGLWEPAEGGYNIHDYLDYNPSKAEVLERRAKRQASGQAGGRASAQARAQGVATHVGQALASHTFQAKPNPRTPSPSEEKNPSVGFPVQSPSPAGAPDGRPGSGNTKGKRTREAEQAEYERVRQREWAMLTPEQREARIAMGMVPPATVA